MSRVLCEKLIFKINRHSTKTMWPSAFGLDESSVAPMCEVAHFGEMPAVVRELGYLGCAPGTSLTIGTMDSILREVSTFESEAYVRSFGIECIVTEPQHGVSPTGTSMLVILDIDETLVDARSSPPDVHIRPGAFNLMLRAAELKAAGLSVWLWTAAIIPHAARCVGFLGNLFGQKLPFDTLVVRGSWMMTGTRSKDIRCLPLATIDRVMLVDNTPEMGKASPETTLVVPSYVFGPRDSCERSHERPTLCRIVDVINDLLGDRNLKVSEYLKSPKAYGCGVAQHKAPQMTLTLMTDRIPIKEPLIDDLEVVEMPMPVVDEVPIPVKVC